MKREDLEKLGTGSTEPEESGPSLSPARSPPSDFQLLGMSTLKDFPDNSSLHSEKTGTTNMQESTISPSNVDGEEDDSFALTSRDGSVTMSSNNSWRETLTRVDDGSESTADSISEIPSISNTSLQNEEGRVQSSGSLPPPPTTPHNDSAPVVKSLAQTKTTEEQLELGSSVNISSLTASLMDQSDSSGTDVSDEEPESSYGSELKEPGLSNDGGRKQSPGSLPPAHPTSHNENIPVVQALTKTKETEEQLELEGSGDFVSSAVRLRDHRGLERNGSNTELGDGSEVEKGQEDSRDEGNNGAGKESEAFSTRPHSSTTTSNIQLTPSTLNPISANWNLDSENTGIMNMQESTISNSNNVAGEDGFVFLDDSFALTSLDGSITDMSLNDSWRTTLSRVNDGSESIDGSISEVPSMSNTSLRNDEGRVHSSGSLPPSPTTSHNDNSVPVGQALTKTEEKLKPQGSTDFPAWTATSMLDFLGSDVSDEEPEPSNGSELGAPGLINAEGRVQSSGSLPPAHSTSHKDSVPLVQTLTKTKETEEQLQLQGSMDLHSLIDRPGSESDEADVPEKELGKGLNAVEDDSSDDDNVEGAAKGLGTFFGRPRPSARTPSPDFQLLKPSTFKVVSANWSLDSGNTGSGNMQESTIGNSNVDGKEDDSIAGNSLVGSITNMSLNNSGRETLTPVHDGSGPTTVSNPEIPSSNAALSSENVEGSLGSQLRSQLTKDEGEGLSHSQNVPPPQATKVQPPSFRELWAKRKKDKDVVIPTQSASLANPADSETTLVSKSVPSGIKNNDIKGRVVPPSYSRIPTQVPRHTSHSNVSIVRNVTEIDCGPFSDRLVPSLLQLQQKRSFMEFSSTFPWEVSVSPWFVTKIQPLLKDTYSMLLRDVSEMEDEFEKNICLPDNDMNRRVASLASLKVRIPRELPEALREAYSKIIESFSIEYSGRNKTVRMYEDDAAQALIQEACKYYREEMNFIINSQEFIFTSLNSSEKEIREEAMNFFVEAAGFRNKVWKNQYTGELAARLVKEFKEFFNSQHNKIFDSGVRTALREYRAAIEAFKPSPRTRSQSNTPFSTDPFLKFGLSAKEHSKKCLFEQLKAVKGLEEVARVSLMQNFDKECEEIAQAQAKLLVQHWKDEKEKEAASKRPDPTNLEVKGNQKAKMDLNPTKPNVKAVMESELSECRNTTEASKPTPGPNGEEKSPCPDGTETSTAADSLITDQSLVSEKFPSVDMAIYFGIYRTYAGIFKPGTEEFLLIADVENKLYFKEESLLNYYGEEKASKDKRKIKNGIFDFSKLIFYSDVNETHYINGIKGWEFRIEDFISYTFATLKWKAELQVRAKIPTCVICIPQSFNSIQKRAVTDAAVLAGFESQTLINDTNAIALALTMEKNVHLGSITAANTCEKFIDVACFDVESGVITCRGVNGDNFITEQELNTSWKLFSFWKDPEAMKIQKLFNFPNSNKKSRSVEDIVIVCQNGDERTVDKIYATLQRHGKKFGPTYPLRGAAYLAAMYSSHLPTNPVRDRWRSFTKSDSSEQQLFRSFTDSLLIGETRKHNDRNPKAGKNMDTSAFEKRKSKFYLQLQKQLHSAKMDVLVKAFNLRARLSVQQEEHLIAETLEPLERIEMISDDLQDPSLTLECIKRYNAELDTLFSKGFSS